MATSRGRRTDFLGASLTALWGGALALNLLLIAGLLALLATVGLAYFWPRPVERVVLDDGTTLMGEVHDREPLPVTPLVATAGTLWGVTHVAAARTAVIIILELVTAILSAVLIGGEAMSPPRSPARPAT